MLTQAQKQARRNAAGSPFRSCWARSFLDFLSGFLKAHPRIRIDLFITNTFLDLLAENVDVAIRFGELRGLERGRHAHR